MATIITRAGKGSPLENAEVDANFTNLNTDKLEKSGGTMTGDLSFGDNDKAIFGDSNDLQIYHDGSHSRLKETGTGSFYFDVSNSLFVRRNDTSALMASFETGVAKLYWDNNQKLATTSTGIDVTGTVSIDDTGGTYRGGVGLASSLVSGGASTNIGVQAQGLLSFATGGITERMRIDSSGNVGIGTSSPSNQLHLHTTSTSNVIQLTNSATGTGAGDGMQIVTSSLEMQLRNREAGPTTFYTSNTERMRIDSSGNVGVGTSSPDTRLTLRPALATDYSLHFGTYAYGTSYGSKIFVQSEDPAGTTSSFYNTSKFVSSINGRSNVEQWLSFVSSSTSSDYQRFSTAGTERMRIDGSGNVGIGTSSPSGALHVYGGPSGEQYISSSNSAMRFVSTGGANYIQSGTATSSSSAADLIFTNVGGSGETMRITSSGDVGIGTSSPSTALQAWSSTANGLSIEDGNYPTIALKKTGFDPCWVTTLDSDLSLYSSTGNNIRFGVGSERMRIDSSGRVGIGTSSPAKLLHIYSDSGNADVRVQGGGASDYTSLYHGSSASGLYNSGTTPMVFSTNNQERMRIDSSGNLLVGKTATGFGTAGIEARADNTLWVSRSNATPAYINRLSSNGNIIEFAKDGTTVGSIGNNTVSTQLTISSANSGRIYIQGSPSPATDDSYYLGGPTDRFKDLYLSGGVYLGGTGSANYLDDYEEGTWSPGVVSGSVAADTCRYTKIGERVTVSGRFTTFSNTTTSDHVVITNLPFATRSAQYATGSMMMNNTSTTKTVIPYCSGSATNISMYNSYNSGGWDDFVHSELNSNTVMYFSITYMAA